MIEGPGRRVLIASATVGAGHIQAALALEEAWKISRKNDEVVCCDILDYMPRFYKRAYRDGYLSLIKHAPELFGRFFSKTDNPKFIKKFTLARRRLAQITTLKFGRLLRKFRPHIILCTHFLPLEAAGALKKGSKGPGNPLVACVITDFEAHALWFEPRTDITFVATEHTKARLLARGARSDQVFVTGIPISPRFGKPAKPGLVRKRLGLAPHLSTLLILGGGFGVGPIVELVESADKADTRFQMMIVTGSNEKLKSTLDRKKFRHPVKIFGFVTTMPDLMSASDLILTKPGGLSTSEALAMGKPMLLFSPIPGQEAANSDFLLEGGAASKLNHPDDLPYKLGLLLRPERLKQMAGRARKLGRPNAALDICRTASAHLHAQV